jgi:hypothetical protein
MRIALIQNSIVVNVIVASDTWVAPVGYVAVTLPEGSTVGIGDVYDGFGNFAKALPPPSSPIMSRLAFMRRFTSEERIAVRQAALQNVVLADAQELLSLAQEVNLEDPDTVNTVQYMVMLSLLTPERGAEILTP